MHIAGGRWIPCPEGDPPSRRLLDDHLHDVPDPVFDLLEALAARAPRPLTVVLEQDGRYPPFSHLLGQLDRARAAVSRGRARQTTRVEAGDRGAPTARVGPSPETSPAFEALLARLYSDDAMRLRFLRGPAEALAVTPGLTPGEVDALCSMDLVGLAMAGENFRRKREGRSPRLAEHPEKTEKTHP